MEMHSRPLPYKEGGWGGEMAVVGVERWRWLGWRDGGGWGGEMAVVGVERWRGQRAASADWEGGNQEEVIGRAGRP
jgi:hypothetical protein